MVVYKYGDPEANIVLIQPVGDHDVHDIENEVSEIMKRTSLEFRMIAEILELCKDESKTYYLGGYSLAGLFALWASCRTDRFAGIAAASPSVWFPGFLSYVKEYGIASPAVYLSLGNREERTKNQVMAAVGDCIRELYGWLQEQEIDSILEWNQGNHFKEPGIRTAKAFAWVMERTKGTIRGR